MKTYVINVKYYIPAEDNDEFNRILEETNISNSEYYGGYELVEVETEDEETEVRMKQDFLEDLRIEQQEQM
jgi:hypothetical protein